VCRLHRSLRFLCVACNAKCLQRLWLVDLLVAPTIHQYLHRC